MLDEVWACLRQAGGRGGCNVMRYRDLADGRVAVEVGVEVGEALPVTGTTMMSALPAGLAAVTTYQGPYEGLDTAHQAVLRWCASAGHELTGERGEVYGDWHEDPAQLQTMVFYRLQQARPGDASVGRGAGKGGFPAAEVRWTGRIRSA